MCCTCKKNQAILAIYCNRCSLLYSGALASAFGNLAGDIYSGLDIYCIFGFIGNFFMAWFPYKLWHTLFFGKTSSLQYYDYSLLGGILICQLCLTVFHVRPYIPDNVYEYSCETKYYIVDYILAGVIVLASCILTILTYKKEILDTPVVTALCVVVLLFSVILGCLPMKRGSKKNTGRGDYSLEVG